MIRRPAALRLLGAGMLALAVAPWIAATPAAAGDKGNGPADGHKVTICHRTNSDTNPYVVITVDTDAAGGGKDRGAGDHAAEHQGPVWNATLKDQHIEWGDIIPAYTDDQGVQFPGYNWSAEGQAIYAHGCTPTLPHTSSAPVTTSTSAPPTKTHTPKPSKTTTSSAPVTTSSSAAVTTHTSSAPVTVVTSTATSAPGIASTTASSAPASTVSTVAATSTSAAASSTTASVLPTKIGTTSAAGGVAPAAPLAPTGQGLPRWGMIAVSVALFLAGAALLLLPGRLAVERRRRH